MAKSKPIPQSFTGDYTIHLNRSPDHSSREATGVWVIGGVAWKIFANRNQLDRIRNDYRTAEHNKLSTPSYQLYEGTVTYSRLRTSPGFALATSYIANQARFFALKSGTATFKQLVRPITNDRVLEEIERNLLVAKCMGLRDPQGFIDQYASKPLVFIDIHTSTTPAATLEEMYDWVRNKRANL